LQLFNQLLNPTEQTKILDIGAEINPDNKSVVQFIDNYPWKNNVSALNLSSQHISLIKRHYPEIDARVGDACDLPWSDNHFDIVFSNAVIEHLGSFEKQKKMADEIMRVGKSWFVTTPNRWYPFEFHMRLPFVTWLPRSGYIRIGRIISYNHMKRKYVTGISRDNLRLMTARELNHCFPTSRIIRQRVTFMPETLICIGGLD
jgi:ubiquinone/menaquinone biosynthesis C-methylase UbiE